MNENDTPVEGADAAAPVAETETQAPPAEPVETPEESRKRGAAERIGELTALRRQAERDRDYWRQQALQGQQVPAPVEAPKGRPTLEGFGFDQEKYLEALADYKVSERIEARDKEQRAAEEQKQQQAKASTLQKRLQVTAAKYEDFSEVVTNPDLRLPAKVLDAAMELGDSTGDVLYFLGKNPEKAAEIAEMSGPKAAIALARIEAQLSQPAVQRQPQVTQAPPPPAVVGTRVTVQKDPEKMTADEWRVHREKELSAKAKAMRRK